MYAKDFIDGPKCTINRENISAGVLTVGALKVVTLASLICLSSFEGLDSSIEVPWSSAPLPSSDASSMAVKTANRSCLLDSDRAGP